MASFLLYYIVIVNLITFVVRGVDKWKAVGQQWRIPEKYLLGLVGLGGFVGAITGMQLFRHKTIKGKFLVWFWLIVCVWIVLSIILLARQ